MTPIFLDMPETHAERATWVETQLMGFAARQFLAELAGNPLAPNDRRSLAEALGKQREAVLRDGLAVLSPETLRELLRRPALLGELQELVLIEGGRHWHRQLAAAPEVREASERVRRRLAQELERRPVAAPAAKPVSVWQQAFGYAFAVAAGLALAVGVQQFVRPAGPAGGGIAQLPPAALPPEIADAAVRKALLGSVADAAERQWAAAAAPGGDPRKALDDVRTLCRLLVANERKNPDPDLLNRCLKWSDKFDGAAKLLAANAADAAALKTTTETVGTLVKTLRAAT